MRACMCVDRLLFMVCLLCIANLYELLFYIPYYMHVSMYGPVTSYCPYRTDVLSDHPIAEELCNHTEYIIIIIVR